MSPKIRQCIIMNDTIRDRVEVAFIVEKII